MGEKAHISISVDEEMLNRIDEEASKRFMNRSEFFRMVAREELDDELLN
jgi:metal-responsive CopG/Arc/MetJ family transcriptional regulator